MCTLLFSSITDSTAGEWSLLGCFHQHTLTCLAAECSCMGASCQTAQGRRGECCSCWLQKKKNHCFYISQAGSAIPTGCLKCWNSPSVFFGHWRAISGQKPRHAVGLSTSTGLLCQENFAHYKTSACFINRKAVCPDLWPSGEEKERSWPRGGGRAAGV